MAGSVVQYAQNSSHQPYVNISPAAGNLLALNSGTSAGGGTPTATFEAMSGTNGTGSVLATFTIPATLASRNVDGGDWETGAYLENIPSGVASILATYNGGTPGTVGLQVAEMSGLATSSAYIVAAHQRLVSPGTGTDAITTGTASVSSIPAFIFSSAFMTHNAATVAAGTGYTSVFSGTGYMFMQWRREAGSTGSYAATATDATNGGGHTYSISYMAFAEASSTPQVTLADPLATVGFRLRSIPDLEAGDIVEYEVYAGTGTITVNTDGSFVASAGVTHFRYRIDDGGGFGDWTIDEVQPRAIRPATILRLPVVAVAVSGSGTVS
jgi:hypothetical protein